MENFIRWEDYIGLPLIGSDPFTFLYPKCLDNMFNSMFIENLLTVGLNLKNLLLKDR